ARDTTSIGSTYAIHLRSWPGSRADALKYYTATLQVVAADTYPDLWDETQLNLGRLYLERMDGDRSPHLERAIQCFCAALRYFNREQHAAFWAQSQTYLGVAYIQRLEGERASNLERALRCLQAALRVVTYEALPEQWGETHR